MWQIQTWIGNEVWAIGHESWNKWVCINGRMVKVKVISYLSVIFAAFAIDMQTSCYSV